MGRPVWWALSPPGMVGPAATAAQPDERLTPEEVPNAPTTFPGGGAGGGGLRRGGRGGLDRADRGDCPRQDLYPPGVLDMTLALLGADQQ